MKTVADAMNLKRLAVAEGEFANVLKVMAREGNTLSPVLRSAWDYGNLRSMTKNSEARATGAHISIIGHITKDELRRLLTETEQANGFGNRFLWLAVRRVLRPFIARRGLCPKFVLKCLEFTA